ncbi:hypothetical protein P0082_04305 [Candidatus Haliotispira prima]|uniref:Uncharacterized protein n=1 Tax=Candidatus Haliotispira prima TaxID=3034016 RepID=A0ABY8MMV2_9SPIO|nr:hypothetical protein P0082_04305 [Candidatus Haliotispira prima]
MKLLAGAIGAFNHGFPAFPKNMYWQNHEKIPWFFVINTTIDINAMLALPVRA